MERSRDRFTIHDLEKAANDLGFGPNGTLGVEYDEADVEESFIENAWKECVKKSWRDPDHGSELLRTANEALRILAEARGSEALKKIWENGKDRVMNPERAYDTLEVPKDVDDMMLITVFNMRVCAAPFVFPEQLYTGCVGLDGRVPTGKNEGGIAGHCRDSG